MFEKVLGIIITFVLISLMIYVILETPKEGYIYECTDFQGNLVYCTSAYTDRGGMFGTTEDGTRIVLTSYKKISGAERKDKETKE
jgi:hypothetical protein